jgi:hypothetical protein
MEVDFEKFMAQTKNVKHDPALDAELDELMKDDPEFNPKDKKIKHNDSCIVIYNFSKFVRLG